MRRINKKADVAIIVLVIGIFLLCTVAIASFLISNSKFEKNFYGMNLAEQVNADVEQFYNYINLGYSPQDSAKMINASAVIENGKLIVTIDRKIDGKIEIQRKIYYNLK